MRRAARQYGIIGTRLFELATAEFVALSGWRSPPVPEKLPLRRTAARSSAGRVLAGVEMPLQNRVTPLGELIADPARGLVYGNRGCLHDSAGHIRRRYNGKRWIACRLSFRGWHRHPLMQPGRFTELFFLDEATALAAGHRPCALCRRDDYDRVLTVVNAYGADAIDAQLHAERVEPATRAQQRHAAQLDELPDGAFVLDDGAPWLVRGGELLHWTPGGYDTRKPRPTGRTTLLTPPTLVEVLRAGWSGAVPLLHPTS